MLLPLNLQVTNTHHSYNTRNHNQRAQHSMIHLDNDYVCGSIQEETISARKKKKLRTLNSEIELEEVDEKLMTKVFKPIIKTNRNRFGSINKTTLNVQNQTFLNNLEKDDTDYKSFVDSNNLQSTMYISKLKQKFQDRSQSTIRQRPKLLEYQSLLNQPKIYDNNEGNSSIRIIPKINKKNQKILINEIKWNQVNEQSQQNQHWGSTHKTHKFNLQSIVQDLNLPSIDLKQNKLDESISNLPQGRNDQNLKRIGMSKSTMRGNRQGRNMSQYNIQSQFESQDNIITKERLEENFNKNFKELQSVFKKQKIISSRKMTNEQFSSINDTEDRSSRTPNLKNQDKSLKLKEYTGSEFQNRKQSEMEKSREINIEDSLDGSVDEDDATNMYKILGKNSYMEQIEREIQQLMKEDNFLNEQSQALSAGGPIDKMELKVTNFDIAGAFTSISNQGGLRTQKTKIIDELMVEDDFEQNSQNMRSNSFFQKFMTKHEHSIERAIERLHDSTNAKISSNVKQGLMNFLIQNNAYRKVNNELFKELKIKGQTQVMENFTSGGLAKRYDPSEVEKIRKRNSKLPHELMYHERFEEKKTILTNKEVNRLKEQNYGKWYLKPDDFNVKINKLNKKFENLNRAFGFN
eukprot:403371062